MSSRRVALALCGATVLGLVGCGASSKTGAASTTTFTTATTVPSATSTTADQAITETTTTTPAASGSTVRTSPASTSKTGATTTVGGRVVTKPDDNVHLGDTGPGVKQIQTALAAQGYKVSADGNFGAQTAQAVKAFQAKNGLKQDGVVGPATWTKLQAAPTGTTTKAATTTTVKRTSSTTVKRTTTTT